MKAVDWLTRSDGGFLDDGTAGWRRGYFFPETGGFFHLMFCWNSRRALPCRAGVFLNSSRVAAAANLLLLADVVRLA